MTAGHLKATAGPERRTKGIARQDKDKNVRRIYANKLAVNCDTNVA